MSPISHVPEVSTDEPVLAHLILSLRSAADGSAFCLAGGLPAKQSPPVNSLSEHLARAFQVGIGVDVQDALIKYLILHQCCLSQKDVIYRRRDCQRKRRAQIPVAADQKCWRISGGSWFLTFQLRSTEVHVSSITEKGFPL